MPRRFGVEIQSWCTGLWTRSSLATCTAREAATSFYAAHVPSKLTSDVQPSRSPLIFGRLLNLYSCSTWWLCSIPFQSSRVHQERVVLENGIGTRVPVDCSPSACHSKSVDWHSWDRALPYEFMSYSFWSSAPRRGLSSPNFVSQILRGPFLFDHKM